MSYKRSVRVAEIIRETLSGILLGDIRDPRLKGVTITRCETSSDLKYAKVFFSVLDDTEDNKKDSLAGMKSAKGYWKRELGKRSGFRLVPELTFHYDSSVRRSVDMSKLLNQIKEEREALKESEENDSEQ